MSQRLVGKVAVITGANSGIGLATAKRFVEEGAHVFITGRRQNELDVAVNEIGRCVTAVQGDVSKLADIDRLFATVREKRGSIDILFANAGVLENFPLGEISEEHFDRLFDINVKGVLFTVQKALPLLKDGGSIILTASVAGSKAFPAASVYCATKAAVRSFARTWTLDLKPRKIRVNVISPGPIETPMGASIPKEFVEAVVRGVPMSRFGTPEEVAAGAVFLASDESSYITGIELFIDGGSAQV
jgi:NAD(P)-dependent dehydrogenase (short-subunit alcohol dehydrogenase family)